MINIRYKQPSGSQFNLVQQKTFLQRFGIDVYKNGEPVRVIFESSTTEDDNFVSQTLYVTAQTTSFQTGDVFYHDGVNYKVMYSNNDFSGLSDFYISLESTNDRPSKYK